MEILKRASQTHKFKVLRSFQWKNRAVQPGEEIEIKNPSEALGFTQRKCVAPSDIPRVGQYVCLQNSVLPGKQNKFEAKRNEVVEILDIHVLDLLLKNFILPMDPNQWRPYNRKLKK